MTNSIWGDMDVEDIPDDPFKVPENTYRCICTKAYEVEKDGNCSLKLYWAVDEPTSDYHQRPISEQFPLYKKKFEELDGKQKQRTSFLKKRLREAFDLTGEELKTVPVSSYVGKYAYLTIVNNVDEKDSTITYNNIRSALCERLYAENKTNEDAVNGQEYNF